MNNLINIQGSSQEVAEAIKAVLSIDVTIVSSDLIRIAATGRYSEYIGEQLQRGCSYDFILKNKKSECIFQKDINDRCLNCGSVESCEEVATIGYPIIDDDNEPLGVIGLIAFNQEQKNYILNNSNSINVFLNKLSFLLAGNIQYENTIQNLLLKNKEINNIINSLDQGIIITDTSFNIKNYNKKIFDILPCKESNLKNNNLMNIFDNLGFPSSTDRQISTIKNTISKSSEEFLIKTVVNKLNSDTKSYFFLVSKYSNAIIDAYNILESKSSVDFSSILGNSVSIKNTITLSKQVAKSNSSIMIWGESGTGKELFARAIHNSSLRKNHPFVAINCASIPDSLLESELFGYEKGAFTGANNSGKLGRFELANGGTLFLDEIGDLPIHLQPKLLRVLQDGTFTRLGGNKTINVNFRLITATNKILENLIKQNQFREDLYYRLNVIPVNIPPLRDRKDDIPIIAQYKLHEYCTKLNKGEKVFSKSLLEILKNSYWKGNVRELENIVEYLVNISNGFELTEDLLPDSFFQNMIKDSQKNYSEENNYHFSDYTLTLKKQCDNFEKLLLNNYVEKYGTSTKNKQEIANLLDIDLSTLYRKLYKYDLI